jgi:hypothetical protein
VTKLCCCARCEGALEPVQQLRYLVETANLDNPIHLARIRVLPSANGKPLPVCKACQAALQGTAHRSTDSGSKMTSAYLLGAFGVLSIGILFGALFGSRG